MSSKFPSLFSPIKIGPLEIKNRIALAPMANYMSDEDGTMTEQQCAFLERRARGGAGLLIVGSLYVQHPTGRFGIGQLGMYDDKLIPAYRRMVDIVHARGAKIAGQLHHAGRVTTRAAINGLQPVAPSPIPVNIGKYVDPPHELSRSEIQQLVEMYAQAARRCAEAGFDGIEIHMAHGYLPLQFMSPLSNKRSDEYGGDVAGRTRFPREIIRAVKAAVGEGLPVWCRIIGDEMRGEEGLQVEDMKVIASLLVQAGAQAISVTRDGPPYFYNAMNYRGKQGYMVHLAEGIKSVVDVPVFTVGSITEPAFSEAVLREGRADIIALGRTLICEPDWPNKAAAGWVDDIRPCIHCNLGCRDTRQKDRHTQCLSNAECGREGKFDIIPATTAKKVLVVGGGPAGLEAARVARQRGHEVTLLEKNNSLGGQFRLGAAAPDKDGLERLLGWWVRQAEKAGVRIELGKSVTADDVRRMAPDALVLATGGKPAVPPIPGIQRESVVTAPDVLAGTARVGNNVLIIGGGQTGAEAAEFLALRNKKVTIVEMLGEIATNVPPDSQYFSRKAVAELGVRALTSTSVKEIGEHSVTLTRESGGDGLVWSAVLEPVDTVVLAVGVRSERGLADEVASLVPEIYVVGDAATPGTAMAAVHQAAIVARKI